MAHWAMCFCSLLQPVTEIVKAVVEEEKLGSLPLFLWGGSSGGSFVQMLPGLMPEVKVGCSGRRRRSVGRGKVPAGPTRL